MLKWIAIFVTCVCIHTAFAQVNPDSTSVSRLPSIIIRADNVSLENLNLVNENTNAHIPLINLSRQFVKPGDYLLSCKQWGYYKYSNEFKLGEGENKEISITLTPIDYKIIRRYDKLTTQNKLSIISTIVTLGAAGLFKIMGDKDYDKYHNAIDENDITHFRKTSNTYQIAFITSSSLCIGSAATWIITKLNKRKVKTAIDNEMNKIAP